MPALVVRQFGGIMPSLEPRVLPAESAQTAQNLDLRKGDFRPLRVAGAAVAGTGDLTGAKSVFRTPSGAWLSSTTDTNFVLGQLQDTTDEYVYLTGRAAYPEVWKSGQYRRLGVPAPTAAPSLTVTTVDEFSTDELVHARTAIPEQLVGFFKAALVPTGMGNAPSGAPTPTTPGWLAHGAVAGMPTKSALQYAFCVPMVLSGADYIMYDQDAHNFLLAAELGGTRVTYSGNPYWAVPIYMQGQGATINTVQLTNDLKTVMNPADGVTRLWSDGDVDNVVAAVVARYVVTDEPRKGLVDAINAEQVNAGKVWDSAIAMTELKAAMTAFFARSEVVAELSRLRGSPGAGDSSASLSGAYTQEVAGRCYELGHFDSTMAESDVAVTDYFSDVYVTTVAAAIRADYDACLVTDRRGATTYDRAKLGKVLRDAMNEINDQRTVNKWPTSKIDANVEYCLGILDRTFNDAHWATNPAWPYSRGADARLASAAVAVRDQLRTQCDALTAHYESLRDEVITYIEQKAFDQDILPNLPPVIDRIAESRSYVYTHVTDWGEESAPSPPTDVIDCDQNDTVTLVANIPPTGRNIRRMRLYRSSSSNSGSAFQFVVESEVDVFDSGGGPVWTDAANRTYVDHVRQEDLQEPCPTLTWAEPPAAGVGLVGMPNGVMLMFDGPRVHACEPFTPYAWPAAYRQTMEFPFVAAAVFGQTAVILTTGNPYYASGADSASLTLQKIESNQACVSKRSVAGGEGGVFYASPDGICLASPSGVTVLTLDHYTREAWQALNPTNSIGRFHDGVYYLLLASGTCISIDLVSKRVSTMALSATALYSDLLTDILYAVSGASLVPLFQGATYMTGLWRSRVFVAAEHPGFGWLRVESDFETSVTVRFYGDGVLRHTATVSSPLPQRLPAGRFRDIEVEVESTCRVTGVAMATSSAELAAV